MGIPKREVVLDYVVESVKGGGGTHIEEVGLVYQGMV